MLRHTNTQSPSVKNFLKTQFPYYSPLPIQLIQHTNHKCLYKEEYTKNFQSKPYPIVYSMTDIKIFSVFFIALLFYTMQSCESAEPAVVIPERATFANVDERLWEFFENFEEEAEKRGLAFDLNTFNLIGTIEDIHDDGVAGTCSYGFRGPRDVTVDEPFWNAAGSLSREMIVFHELGHCVLDRDHSEALTDNGFCASIMRSGTGNCRTLYNSLNRDYYVDELFEVLNP